MHSLLVFLFFSVSLLIPGKALCESFPVEKKLENSEVIRDTVSFTDTDELVISAVSIEVETKPAPLSAYPRATDNPYKFRTKEIIAPAVLLGVGAAGLSTGWKKHVNEPVKDALQGNGHSRFRADDYLEFVPAVAGYGMNLFGFKGMHNVADATIIYGTAYILLAATALPLKYAVHSERPNLKNDHSFPSAHTAIAFCGAELLRREYWNVSPWIGVGGYVVATATGFLRLYNNAHWLNDVLAGAGLGILCAEAAYWLYPVITKAFFKKRHQANIFLMPAASRKDIGLACSIVF